MKVTLLHTADAAGPPVDPVLGQLEGALRANGHEPRLLMVDATVEPVMRALLQRLTERYGSTAGYLRAHGLGDDEIGELRRVLLRDA